MARTRRKFVGPPTTDQGTGRQFDVWPIEKFPIEMQWDIACDVLERRPPARMLRFELCQIQSRAWSEWHWQRGIDPDKKRPAIPRALRGEVYERDGHACVECGTTQALSLDHIYPFSLGGPDTLDNLRTLCRSCNSRKGARI
jgi:5-methylcytosine-specific restriction endonuclease McrA